jgi:hypothetical protein
MVDAAEVMVASSLYRAVRRRPDVNITELRFPGFDAAGARGAIRWALFQHRAVVDVQLTGQADTLQIRHHGPADVESWTATLVDAGLPAPRLAERPAAAGALHGAAA